MTHLAKSNLQVVAAKTALKLLLKDYDWVRGIGITKTESGSLALLVNISEDTVEIQKKIPKSVDGFPIVFKAVGSIVAR